MKEKELAAIVESPYFDRMADIFIEAPLAENDLIFEWPLLLVSFIILSIIFITFYYFKIQIQPLKKLKGQLHNQLSLDKKVSRELAHQFAQLLLTDYPNETKLIMQVDTCRFQKQKPEIGYLLDLVETLENKEKIVSKE